MSACNKLSSSSGFRRVWRSTCAEESGGPGDLPQT